MSKVLYPNLMYIMVCIRPDLEQGLSQVCKFMSKISKHHCEAIKWIFKYLKGKTCHGIMFSNEKGDPSVVGSSICWKSLVESIVAIFTIEA